MKRSKRPGSFAGRSTFRTSSVPERSLFFTVQTTDELGGSVSWKIGGVSLADGAPPVHWASTNSKPGFRASVTVTALLVRGFGDCHLKRALPSAPVACVRGPVGGGGCGTVHA